MPCLDVWIAVPRGSLALDWAGPAEALRMANLEAPPGQPFFRLIFTAPHSTAPSSVGVQLAGLQPLPQQVNAPAWILVVGNTATGNSALDQQADDADDRAVTAWLTALQPGRAAGLRLVTICAGALLAASAGLLANHRVTTHHQSLEDLRTLEPSALVEPDRVFVRDGEVWSSAGVTTGIDLALHLISEHTGPVVAARVAQRLAVAMRRGPNDPQLSPFLAHRQHLNARLHRVQDAVSQAPREPWDTPRMAAVACTTPRTLNRLFAEHASTTPLAYVRGIRVALASHALAQGTSVLQAADMAGFSSDLQLRRAWRATGSPGLPSARRQRRASTR